MPHHSFNSLRTFASSSTPLKLKSHIFVTLSRVANPLEADWDWIGRQRTLKATFKAYLLAKRFGPFWPVKAAYVMLDTTFLLHTVGRTQEMLINYIRPGQLPSSQAELLPTKHSTVKMSVKANTHAHTHTQTSTHRSHLHSCVSCMGLPCLSTGWQFI